MATEVDTERDRKMILSPYQWPLFYLPLKRCNESGFPDVAILRTATNNANADFTVEENMSILGPVGDVVPHVYKGVDALLADGWVVD